jgi:hypothetical protein
MDLQAATVAEPNVQNAAAAMLLNAQLAVKLTP